MGDNTCPMSMASNTSTAHSTVPRFSKSYNISDLILSDQNKLCHLGKRCKTVTELLMVKRSGKTLHGWRTARMPTYFKGVEKNSGVDRLYRKFIKHRKCEAEIPPDPRNMSEFLAAAKERERDAKRSSGAREVEAMDRANDFKRTVFKRILHPDLLRFIDTFGFTRFNINSMLEECTKKRSVSIENAARCSIFKEWVPAGIDGGVKNSAKLPLRAVKALYTATVKGSGVAFGGYTSMPESGKEYYKDLHNNTYKLLDGEFLMCTVFNLSGVATSRIRRGETTLLREVHEKCVNFRANRPQARGDQDNLEVYVGPEENVFEIKLGVYFVPSKGKVYKFLNKPNNYPEFFSEVSVGLYIEETIKGICGVTSVCPEHFCFEMKYSGPNLDLVIRGDYNTLAYDRKSKEMCIYNVIMMQSTPGQFRVPAFSGLIQKELTRELIRDSRTAIGVLNIFRRRLLQDIPFFLVEMINIITGMGQQGLVNVDIKVDNFVMDGNEGGPRMIDLNIVLPSGYKDPPSGVISEDFIRSPQSPPEYLRGQRCREASMSYCLAHTLTHILKSLSDIGDFSCISLHTNMKLSKWISEAYDERVDQRPLPHLAAMYIFDAFPFEKSIKNRFLKPKHTVVSMGEK